MMIQPKRITVFGASGNIGKELIRLLSTAGIPAIAVTRDMNKAFDLPFVEWKQADMADIKTLAEVMSGSSAVFLLSGISKNFVEEQINVIQVAKEQHVKHIVKLSSGAADENSSFYIPRVHGEVEEFIKQSGIGWTMLQPNGIMQNWLGETADTVKRQRKIIEPTAEGKRAHVDRRDIAEVAFRILTDPETHHDKSYLLTSDRAISYGELAEVISNAIGEPVIFVSCSIEEMRSQMEHSGMPAFLIDTFISYDKAQRDNKAAVVTDHVKTILNRPARTVEAFVKNYVDRSR